ncbi:MAG TPA: asparaginase [Thermoanaerobaculia bacterium]|nr:asparaginase [Thermoanaerobaculia bacterium]
MKPLAAPSDFALPSLVPIAAVVRNGRTESWIFGAAAVATPTGSLVASAGDPDLATYVRSAAKPFQILPLLLAGGAERFSLDAADLALICASHGGRPEHAERAARLLERGGFSVADLLCGAHAPFDPEAARELRQRGEEPTALRSNCSGKHAGMLLACRLLGLPAADYVDPGHPLQRRILAHVASLARVEESAIGIGIDGCSVPAYHLSLAAAARAYAALADPAGAGLSDEVAAALGQVAAAMGAEPEMVAGPGRFTTRLIAATGGRVIGKEGAEGFYAMAVRSPFPLGLAFKVADGGERGRDGVALEMLRQMGALSGEELSALDDLIRPAIRTVRGIPIGEVSPEIELVEVPAADDKGSAPLAALRQDRLERDSPA